MTTVATISASAPSGAAGFTGPARSSETSDQFAIELGKTTQQVRERGNSAESGPNPPQGAADKPSPASVENPKGNEVASGTDAAQQGEEVEPQQLLEAVEVGLDGGDHSDLDIDQSLDQQSLVSTPIVAIAPAIILPSDSLVAVEESATAVAPVPVLPKAVVSSPVTLAAGMTSDVLPTDSVEPTATIPVATLATAPELGVSQTAAPAPPVSPDNLTPVTVTPVTVTPGTVSPGTVTPGTVTPDISTPVTIAPVTLTPNNLTPVTVTPGNLSAPPSEVVSPAAQLPPSITAPVDSESQIPPTATRTSPVGEGAPVGTPASAASSAPGATVQVVANQGGDSQQSSEPSGSGVSQPEESAVVGREPDQLSDELAKVESGATGRMQVADAAQGVDPRVTTAGTNPVATTAPTPVAFESNSPVTVSEPKAPAPASTPIPVSTQMSAHLSAFRGLADGTYETTIRLNPEELGQVSVRIQVNGGSVSIHAFGASDIAVQALREAMPDLRQDLLRSGLDLVDSQVDQGSASFGNDREAASDRPLDTDKTDGSAENRIGRPTGADVDAISDMNRSEGGLLDVRV